MKIRDIMTYVLMSTYLVQEEEAKYAPNEGCLYCKRADSESGFLKSYYYCPTRSRNDCIEDYWNYIEGQRRCLKPI